MIKYKTDIIQLLKDAGYNTHVIRKNNLLSEGILQSLRKNQYISLTNLGRICDLLKCQPGDIIENV